MFKAVKREKEFSVKQLNNGFVISVGGRDEDGDWMTDEVYVDSLDALKDVIEVVVAIDIDR